nr:reverse transcriptase domain-containing protein [Tanacetum cinerariifolium]
MLTKIELTPEQLQQGVSTDVLVSIKGVEELKRNVRIKGENKAALPTLKAETWSIHMLSIFTKVNSDGNPSRAIIKQALGSGGAHPYYQCLAADGNIFPELRDNIQGYVLAAVVNYNQGNSGYRPLGVANQIRPSGFAQPNVQNNQNWFSQPQGYNRGNNFNQYQPYQALTHQNQVVPLSELEKIKIMNETNMKAMQTQINNVKNKLRNEMKNSIQASMSNQTNELKYMMASFFQINTASTSGSGPLPSNTIANPKGELKAITTRSGIVLDGPSVPIPPPFINPEEDERVEETLTDQDLAEYTIKVPPPLVQKPKPPPQINFVVHQKDPLHPNISYPSRMHKQKQQEKEEVQIHKFWQMFKQLDINITLVDALILILKYQKMLKALLSNKEKLLEVANTPLNENFSAVILRKLPEKLRDPGKFLIPCGFSVLKCKALAGLGASINLMPLSVWKKFGLPELISTRMTLELANRAICTPAGIARDVFVLVGKFTFPADFVIVDYESDPRVPLILGRPFLQTAHALIDVHKEEMILCGNPTFSSHPDLTSPEVKDDIFDPKGGNVLIEKFLDLDSTKDLPLPHNINPLSGSTTYSSPNHLLEEFVNELTLITFALENDDLLDLAGLNDNLVDTMHEMFTDEHALDYSSPPLYDEYDDDLFEVEFDTEYVYDDPFDSKGEKIKESKLLIDELNLPRSSILIQDKLFEVITRVAPDKNVKKLAISHASLILEDFDPPPLYELPFLKEFLGSKILLSFSSENEEKVFKPGILTSKGVYSSLLPELSHQGPKAFKVTKIVESPVEIFPFSFGEDIRILDVPCIHFYPP